jgi:glycosyltransferase involved in cell wall biosynthesis
MMTVNAENNSPAPRISIVTSVYNGAAYLEDCIQSILRQTFRDFEFILVNDGSTDRTREIIDAYAAQDGRIVPVHKPQNEGVVAGLNTGLETARGQYIARQDADDLSLPERVARQVEFLEQNPGYGVAACQVLYIDSEGEPLDRESTFTLTENDEIQEALLSYMCLCGPSVVVRREALQQAGYRFSDGLDASEDYDLCLRLSEVTRLYNLPEPLYLYRQHGGSASVVREFQQILHKAEALELAVQRRGRERVAPEALTNVAITYLKAAVLAHASGDEESTRGAFQKIALFDPAVLWQSELLERILCYRMPEEPDAAVEYMRSFFTKFLPKTPEHRRLMLKLISSIHMKIVFESDELGESQRVKQHLWKGIRENPGWLKNRGVIKLILRHMV